MAEWTNRLAKLYRPEFHIYDRDTAPPAQPKYQKYIDEINLRAGCRAVATNRREVENYIHKNAINAALAEAGYAVSFTNDVTDMMDVPAELANFINPVVQQHEKWGDRRAKEFLCAVAARKMTKEMLDEVDTKGEVLSWLLEIRGMHRATT